MPSVYDYRHVELDKVGNGKRVIKPPGGETSDIFGAVAAPTNGSGSNGVNGGGSASPVAVAIALDAASFSVPINGNGMSGINGSNGNHGHGNGNGTNGTNGSSMSGSGCSTPTNGSAPNSAPTSRRGSRSEDTKNRLFGPPEDSPRRVRDHLRSNIFTEQVSDTPRSSPKKFVARRNPITGEVYEEPDSAAHKQNGLNGATNGRASNGFASSNGSLSLPTTPVRVRQPPGGKSSGIF